MGLPLPPSPPAVLHPLVNFLVQFSPLFFPPLLKYNTISSVVAVLLEKQKAKPQYNVSVAKQETQVSELVNPGPHTSTDIQRNRKR